MDRGPGDAILLTGLRATGTHGVLDEERTRAQPFEIDLELELDLRPAGAGDDLGLTVDYGAVASAVEAVVAGPHADLLEHLAHLIAVAVLEAAGTTGGEDGGRRPKVTAVTVTVRKLRPPVPQDLASAGVRIRRRREEIT